jgi:hypothetical protein
MDLGEGFMQKYRDIKDSHQGKNKLDEDGNEECVLYIYLHLNQIIRIA